MTEPHAFDTVTVYVPDAAVPALLNVGFCELDVNPFGPVQAKDSVP